MALQFPCSNFQDFINNFQNYKVALNPMYSCFKNFANVVSCTANTNLTIQKSLSVPFSEL